MLSKSLLTLLQNFIKMKNYYLKLFIISLLSIFWFKKVDGIYNGKYVEQNQFKYHVSVYINNYLACGGAMLRNKFILTAAQCILDSNGQFLNVNISVSTGIYLEKADYSRYINKVIRSYVPHNRENTDIAVLKLEFPFPYIEFTAGIHLLLPQEYRSNKYKVYVNAHVNFTGFGMDSSTTYTSANDHSNLQHRYNSEKALSYTHVLILPKTRCKDILADYNGEDHICGRSYNPVSYGFSGGCRGDIGGPLVYQTHTIIGVLVKYVDSCNEINSAGLYTRVSSYESFIKNALDDNSHLDIRYANYNSPNVIEIIPPNRISDLMSQRRV